MDTPINLVFLLLFSIFSIESAPLNVINRNDSQNTTSATKPLLCNDQGTVCRKRYNEVTQIVSHNATSNGLSLVQNQDRSIKEQLRDGIRAFKVPIHFDYQNSLGYYHDLLQFYYNYLNDSLSGLSGANPKYWALATLKQIVSGALAITKLTGIDASKRTIFACHGIGKRLLYEKYIDQIVAKAPDSIRPVIQKIASPLQSVVLKLTELSFGKREEAGGALPFTPCILDTSKQKFTDFLSTLREFLDNNRNEVLTLFLDDSTQKPAEIANSFAASGLTSYVYTQNPDLLWPTFTELINNNKRMIIFLDQDAQETYPWLHYTQQYDGWPTRWEYKSATDLTKKNFTIRDFLNDPALQREKYSPDNKFFLVTHQVTPGLAGSKSDAKIVNAKEVLSYRIKKITEMMGGRKPTFISVDFYEYPHNDALDVARELNKY